MIITTEVQYSYFYKRRDGITSLSCCNHTAERYGVKGRGSSSLTHVLINGTVYHESGKKEFTYMIKTLVD